MWYKLSPEVIKRLHDGKEFNPRALKRFVELNGFTRYCRPVPQDFARFLKTGRSTYGYPHIISEYPPATDHARVFKNTLTGTVCMVSQPYNRLQSITDEAELWAQEHGLIVDLYDTDRSWYYPGSTCLIIWHLPGVQIKV